PLALGEQATTIYADPRQVRNPRYEASTAAAILGIDPNGLYRALADRSHAFVYVERKAPPALATKLARHHLSGFNFYGEEKRIYPQGPVGAQVLGFAGVDNQGLAGLELELNKPLTGVPGEETIV